MMHLNLTGHAKWADGHALRLSAVRVPLADADRHVTVDVPFHLYGQTRVAAIPVPSLSGSVVSLDLGRWAFYDLDGERVIGLTFTTPRPASPECMAVADRYVREARHLNDTALRAWVAQLITQTGGRR